jgi:hypothetical protein
VKRWRETGSFEIKSIKGQSRSPLKKERPCRPRRGAARPILLGCPNAFFEADAVPIEEPPNRTDASLLLTFIKHG